MNRFANNPGNNVLPAIPSLEYVFECPPVRGALQRYFSLSVYIYIIILNSIRIIFDLSFIHLFLFSI